MTGRFTAYRPRLGVQRTTRHRRHYNVQTECFGSKRIESGQIFEASGIAEMHDYLRLLEKISETISNISVSVYSAEY